MRAREVKVGCRYWMWHKYSDREAGPVRIEVLEDKGGIGERFVVCNAETGEVFDGLFSPLRFYRIGPRGKESSVI